MEFQCLVQDKNGKRSSFNLTADSVSVVVGRLKHQGFLPLEIKEIKPEKVKGIKNFSIGSSQFKTKELAVFSRQLASSLTSGILLIEALETIGEDWENPKFRVVIQKIIESIRGGSSFSGALLQFPGLFPETFIALVKAGEHSGALDRTLANLAKYLEDQDKIAQKIKTAIRYPAFVFGFFLFTVFVITVFIIPKFQAIFVRAGIELPLLTKIVLAVSAFVIKNFLLIFILIILGVVIFLLLLKIYKFRLFVDTHIFKIPLLGNILRKAAITRFARTLSILLSAGIGLATSLSVSAQVADNVYFKILIDNIKGRVVSGFSLGAEINNQKFFTRMFAKMVQVGEKTGKIGDMLKHNANYYDEELEASINNFIVLLEPTLIVLIGGVVLVVVLALYLPIFKMATLRR